MARHKPYSHELSQALGGHPYTVSALFVLHRQTRSMHATELAREVGLYPGGATKLMRHMDKWGLAMYTEHPGYAGRKRYEVKISELGERLVQPLRDAEKAYMSRPHKPKK